MVMFILLKDPAQFDWMTQCVRCGANITNSHTTVERSQSRVNTWFFIPKEVHSIFYCKDKCAHWDSPPIDQIAKTTRWERK